jgi:hypothetical protein
MSLQGRTLRMVRAGKPVSVGERVRESDAFTLYRAWAGDAPLAVSWYPDLPGTRSLAKLPPDHSERYFGSTSPFMAPEVVRGEAPVSWRSDRHSLAVLLFFLFMHGHPLDGSNTDPDAGDESEVTLRALGPGHRGAVALGPGAAGGLRPDLLVRRIGSPRSRRSRAAVLGLRIDDPVTGGSTMA